MGSSDCDKRLHSKGARQGHRALRLVLCSLCAELPARLHCNFIDKSFCHHCYAMRHIKMLPPDGKDNAPRQIDYIGAYQRHAELARVRALAHARPQSWMEKERSEMSESFSKFEAVKS